MMFQTTLMADPVVASDGYTYERESIVLWMKNHSTSPTTSEPLEHKLLIPNHLVRKQIVAWCEQVGAPVPKPSKPAANHAAAVEVAPLLQKPTVTCSLHAKEQLRVFCNDCNRAICTICAVDSDICKPHTTKAFEPLFEELKVESEGWERAVRECNEEAEQLCAAIQADGNSKARVYSDAISAQVARLQEQVRSAVAARSSALGAILQKRREREERVAGAAASLEIAVKGSSAAAVISSALHRAKAPVPPASAAQFLCRARGGCGTSRCRRCSD